MVKGAIYARREKFIKLMVTVEDVAGMIKAYKEAYPACKKDETARVSAYRLLQQSTIVREIDRLKKKREAQLEEARRAEIQRIAREQVATELEVDAAMSLIATGRYRQKRLVVKYDAQKQEFVEKVVDEGPDPSAMVSAADKLYKRKGSYKPLTVQHEGGDTFIEFMKTLAKTSNKNIPNAIEQ